MLYALVVVIILILDQGLKYWTLVNIALDTGSKTLIPNVMSLRHVHNTGAAFGFFSDKSWFPLVMVIVVVLMCIAVIIMLATGFIKGSFGRWTIVLVMAGALGNAIDRLFYGFVVDMLKFDFSFMDWFATFNIADVFLVVGGILFCIYILTHKEPEEARPRKRTAGGPSAEELVNGYSSDDHDEADYDRPVPAPRRSAVTDAPEPPVRRNAPPARESRQSKSYEPTGSREYGGERIRDIDRVRAMDAERSAAREGKKGVSEPPAPRSARRPAPRPSSPPPGAQQAPRPAKRPPVEDFDVDIPEFTLEDILSEFSDK